MFSYFSSITVWPLLLVSSTIIFSSSGSRTWGADSLREPIAKTNYKMSNSQILLGHFKDYYFIHCMIHLDDQGISPSNSPFPPHTQVTDTLFTFETTALQQQQQNCLTFLSCCWHNSCVINGDATPSNKWCTVQL